MSRVIGKIVEVTAFKVVCEVIIDQLPFNYKGDTYDLNSVGSLISIYEKFKACTLVYQITKVYENEKIHLKNESSKFDSRIMFDAIPLAQISKDKVDFGIRRFPMVGDSVYISSIDEIEKTYASKEDGIIIGNVNSNIRFTPRLDKERFFTGHMSVFGNTNSGKSTTIKKIIHEKLKINPEFKSIIFDVHDEYHFGNAEIIKIDQLSIDPSYVSIEDWINLINPSSLTQLPILIHGIKIAHYLSNGIPEDLAAHISYTAYNSNLDVSTKLVFVRRFAKLVENAKVKDSLKRFDFAYGVFKEAENLMEGISERFKELTNTDIRNAEEYILDKYLSINSPSVHLGNIKEGINIALTLEESRGNLQVRSHCQTMLTRIELMISQYKNLFKEDEGKREQFNKIFTEKKTKILKVNELSDDTLKFITHLILRISFLKQKNSEQKVDRINFVFDEAHKYIKKEKLSESLVIDIFNTIAREGRKFGVFICIVSQQPHELSNTVVSQCSNFILHRLKNNLDLEFIKKSNPFITEIQLTRLSSLPTGTALILGDAIPVPLELEIILPS